MTAKVKSWFNLDYGLYYIIIIIQNIILLTI